MNIIKTIGLIIVSSLSCLMCSCSNRQYVDTVGLKEGLVLKSKVNKMVDKRISEEHISYYILSCLSTNIEDDSIDIVFKYGNFLKQYEPSDPKLENINFRLNIYINHYQKNEVSKNKDIKENEYILKYIYIL